MQVFKYYFRLVRSMRTEIMIYVGVFILAMMAMSAQMPAATSFSVQKPRVVVEDHDDSMFTKGLVSYLHDSAQIVPIQQTKDAYKDALYFQTVDAIYVIPDGFAANFFAGAKPNIAVTHGTGQAPIQADNLVSNYLRLATPRALAGMDQAAVVVGVKADLEKTVTVVTKSQASLTDATKAMYHMNLEAYILLGLNIMVISFIMLRFNGVMVRRRNLVSGTPYRNISLQLFAANLVFSIGIWAIFFAIACALYPTAMLGTYGVLYGISSLLFSLVALVMGFMFGSLISNRRVIPAITNVTALGMSFICGIFVPQQFLGDAVVNTSKLLPAYWYVHANDAIAKLPDFSWQSLLPIIANWAVVIAFAVGLFVITLVLIKRRAR